MTATIELELFGVDHSYRYQLIKKRLVEAMEKSGLPYTLSDISDIEKFIQAGLDSVPSVRVDHEQLFSMTNGDDPEETVQSIYDYIIGKKMQSALVPVDFSPTSRNAAEYAVELAKYYGLKADILHVYHPAVDPHNAVVLDPDLGAIKHQHLDKYAAELRRKARHGDEQFKRPVNARFETGYPLPTIVEVAQEEQVFMLVMGTLGATNVLDDVFGNISSSVAIQVDKPLFLIPPDTAFNPPRHIMVAFSPELMDNGALNKLIELNMPFNAHIDFIHIRESGRDSFDEIRDRLMTELLSNGETPFSFDIREIAHTHKNTAQEIIECADEINPDWLTIVSKHRSFVERLFHASVTRKLCLHGHRPLLVLHCKG